MLRFGGLLVKLIELWGSLSLPFSDVPEPVYLVWSNTCVVRRVLEGEDLYLPCAQGFSLEEHYINLQFCLV